MLKRKNKAVKEKERRQDVTDLLRREVLISVPLMCTNSLPGSSTLSQLWQTCESERGQDRDWNVLSKVCQWFGGVKRYRFTNRLSKKHNKTKNCYTHQPQPTPLPPPKAKVFGSAPFKSTCAKWRGVTHTNAKPKNLLASFVFWLWRGI